MNDKHVENFNTGDGHDDIDRRWADLEKKEREKKEKYQKMVKIAQDVGGQWFEGRGGEHIEFRTWQDALDFQNFCGEEFNFKVKVIEPPKPTKGVTYPSLDNYFKVVPE